MRTGLRFASSRGGDAGCIPTPKLLRPQRILLVATLRWPIAARLAMAFGDFGCVVDVLCPAEHPVARLRRGPRTHAHSVLNPSKSLLAAITAAAPDLIVPCDDDAALTLNLLYQKLRAAQGEVGRQAKCIERSLGVPSACALACARGEIADLASQEGLRVPETRVMSCVADLNHWMAHHDFPMVLKIDNTWGGQGVSIVRDREEAHAAYRRMSKGPSFNSVVVRAALDRDLSPLLRRLKREPRTLSIQDHVRGRPANRAVACWRGEVLAGISVEALHTQHPTGPATVVEVIDNPEMTAASAQLVKRLDLSGLWGFDFMLEASTDAAWLIEVNPRATPISHFALAHGGDLVAALCAQLAESPQPTRPAAINGRTVALFPGEWRRDCTSEYLQSAHHDVPWEEAGLLREGLGPPWERRGILARLNRWLRPHDEDRPGVLRMRSHVPSLLPPGPS